MGAPGRIQKQVQEINSREFAANRLRELELVETFAQGMPAPTNTATVAPPDVDPAAFGTQASIRAYTRASKTFMATGTNSESTGIQPDQDGGFAAITHTVINSEKMIVPLLALAGNPSNPWTVTRWRADKEPTFDTVIQTGAAITTMQFAAGLKLSFASATGLTVATDDHQCMFHFDTSSAVSGTRLRLVTSIAGVDTDVAPSTCPVIAVNTRYALRIKVDRFRIPHFYCAVGNGPMQKLGSGPAMSDPVAVAAAQPLVPLVGVKALAASARTLFVRRIACSRRF